MTDITQLAIQAGLMDKHGFVMLHSKSKQSVHDFAQLLRDKFIAELGEPKAYALMSVRGKPHKLSMTKESCVKKQESWHKEWPDNGSYVVPLYALKDERK